MTKRAASKYLAFGFRHSFDIRHSAFVIFSAWALSRKPTSLEGIAPKFSDATLDSPFHPTYLAPLAWPRNSPHGTAQRWMILTKRFVRECNG